MSAFSKQLRRERFAEFLRGRTHAGGPASAPTISLRLISVYFLCNALYVVWFITKLSWGNLDDIPDGVFPFLLGICLCVFMCCVYVSWGLWTHKTPAFLMAMVLLVLNLVAFLLSAYYREEQTFIGLVLIILQLFMLSYLYNRYMYLSREKSRMSPAAKE